MKVRPMAVINYYDFEEEYLKRYPNEVRPLGYIFPLCPNDSYQLLGLTPDDVEETEKWMYDLPMDIESIQQEKINAKEQAYANFHARQAIIKNRSIFLLREFIGADSVLIDVSW